MNTAELLQYSMGTAFDVLSAVTAHLTQEQADWRPPGTANTIGSVYCHTLTYVDYFVRNYCIEGKRLPETIDTAPAVLWMQDVQRELCRRAERGSDAGDLCRLAYQRPLRRNLRSEGLSGPQGLSLVASAGEVPVAPGVLESDLQEYCEAGIAGVH